nr:MAG TPA: hypothetical protein [Caudoviricetes sp.]DAL78836.1 MAG TPA: hypothetical protein [Caudoviricetes sp.]
MLIIKVHRVYSFYVRIAINYTYIVYFFPTY